MSMGLGASAQGLGPLSMPNGVPAQEVYATPIIVPNDVGTYVPPVIPGVEEGKEAVDVVPYKRKKLVPSPGRETAVFLRKVVHQKRVEKIIKKKAAATPVKAIKKSTLYEADFSMMLNRIIDKIKAECYFLLSTIMHSKEKIAKTRCRIYGHKVPPTWRGDYPRCVDCNVEVRSAEQLHGAIVKV